MHVSVLQKELIAGLSLRAGMTAIDATLGGGGHTKLLAEAVGEKGKVLGIDWDPDAVKRVTALRLAPQVTLAQGNFAELGAVASSHGIRSADGILLDLGFSSDQLEGGRGFSFQKREPLDMRYDPTQPMTAAKLLSWQSRQQLEQLLKEYGEEPYAKAIAQAVVERRKEKEIRTTTDLVSVIEEAVPKKALRQRLHPATKTFQALRIAVNRELDNLRAALPQAEAMLKSHGRMAVISFHSLEDRIVKQYIASAPCLKATEKKPVTPSIREIRSNPRARSAKLRIAEKQ